MPLDYQLSPDSPLQRAGVFECITRKLLNGEDFDVQLEVELIRNGVQGLSKSDRAHNDTVRSLMQVDEYLAPLSFLGAVWFVAQRLRVEPKLAAVAVLSGMPWPLWTQDQRTCLLLSVSIHQATFLKQLFRQRAVDFALLRTWDGPFPGCSGTDGNQDDSMTRKLGELVRRQRQAERAWRDLARRTKQAERFISQTVRALQGYLACLNRYLWHQDLARQAEG